MGSFGLTSTFPSRVCASFLLVSQNWRSCLPFRITSSLISGMPPSRKRSQAHVTPIRSPPQVLSASSAWLRRVISGGRSAPAPVRSSDRRVRMFPPGVIEYSISLANRQASSFKFRTYTKKETSLALCQHLPVFLPVPFPPLCLICSDLLACS